MGLGPHNGSLNSHYCEAIFTREVGILIKNFSCTLHIGSIKVPSSSLLAHAERRIVLGHPMFPKVTSRVQMQKVIKMSNVPVKYSNRKS